MVDGRIKESRLSLTLLSLFLAFQVAAQVHGAIQDDSIEFRNPVRSAAEDEIKDLPGLNFSLNFKQYSGYLDAGENRFFHYWFVESQSNPSKDPLVLWLNGGPGCSSLLGLSSELGFFTIDKGGSLKENKFSFNKLANFIFLESPAGVGFSYYQDGGSIVDPPADDDSTARQNHNALKSFLKKFPSYKNNSLYLTGESYAGVYLPTLGVLVDADPELNLKGIAIGNGYLDANKLAESLILFSYYHGLIGKTTWKGLSSYCCGGRPPTRGSCKFTDATRSAKCSQYVNEASDVILNSGINPYNLYARCESVGEVGVGDKWQSSSREIFDKSLMLSAFNVTRLTRSALFGRKNYPKQFQTIRGDPPCTDDSVITNYLNRLDVKSALHIPNNLKPFATCFDGIQYTMIYPGSREGMAPQMRTLMDSSRKLTLLVYNGDIDLMCNELGDMWFTDDLNRKVLSEYKPWHVNHQVAGFVKHFDGITFATIRGAGHMVPADRPVESLSMIKAFLNAKGSRNVYL